MPSTLLVLAAVAVSCAAASPLGARFPPRFPAGLAVRGGAKEAPASADVIAKYQQAAQLFRMMPGAAGDALNKLDALVAAGSSESKLCEALLMARREMVSSLKGADTEVYEAGLYMVATEAGEMAAQGVLPAEGMARLLKLCAEDLEMTVDVFASNVEAKNAE